MNPRGRDGGDDGATTVLAADEKPRGEARPGTSGVKDEFRTSDPPHAPATILPPPGDATEPPAMLLVAAAFALGFLAMWARERRRTGPPASGAPS